MLSLKLTYLLVATTVLQLDTCLGQIIENRDTVEPDYVPDESGFDSDDDVTPIPSTDDEYDENMNSLEELDTFDVKEYSSLCELKSIDAAITLPGLFEPFILYIFKGSTVFQIDGSNFDEAYPRKLTDIFPGGPPRVDAALRKSDDSVLLFKGGKYWRYDSSFQLMEGEQDVSLLGLKRNKKIKGIVPINSQQVNIYYKKKTFSYNPETQKMKRLVTDPLKVAVPDAALQTCMDCTSTEPIYIFKKNQVYEVDRESMEIAEVMDIKTFFEC